MGEPKLLMEFRGKSIFEITLDNHLESKVPWICAVVPDWIDGFGEIAGRYAGQRVEFAGIGKPCPMSDSLRHGWRRLQERAQPGAVMISLADMPFVSPGTIDKLIEACRTSGKPLCVPVRKGRWGHPVIISSRFGGEIMELQGDQGAKDVLVRHVGDIERVAIEHEEIHLDIDQDKDLHLLKSRLQSDE